MHQRALLGSDSQMDSGTDGVHRCSLIFRPRQKSLEPMMLALFIGMTQGISHDAFDCAINTTPLLDVTMAYKFILFHPQYHIITAAQTFTFRHYIQIELFLPKLISLLVSLSEMKALCQTHNPRSEKLLSHLSLSDVICSVSIMYLAITSRKHLIILQISLTFLHLRNIIILAISKSNIQFIVTCLPFFFLSCQHFSCLENLSFFILFQSLLEL